MPRPPLASSLPLECVAGSLLHASARSREWHAGVLLVLALMLQAESAREVFNLAPMWAKVFGSVALHLLQQCRRRVIVVWRATS